MSVNTNELQHSKYFINLFELVTPRKIFSVLNVDTYLVEQLYYCYITAVIATVVKVKP